MKRIICSGAVVLALACAPQASPAATCCGHLSCCDGSHCCTEWEKPRTNACSPEASMANLAPGAVVWPMQMLR